MAYTKTNRCHHCKFFMPFKAPDTGSRTWKARYAAIWGKCRSTTADAKAVSGYPKRHKMDYCNSFSHAEGPQPETAAPKGFWQEIAERTQNVPGAPRIEREFKPEEKKKLGLDQTTDQQGEVHKIMDEGVLGMRKAAIRGRAKPHPPRDGGVKPGQKKRGRPSKYQQTDLEDALARLDDVSSEHGDDIPGAPPVLKIGE